MPESLEKVSGIIQASVASQNPVIAEGLISLFGGDGKLLRPGLLLIASEFGKPQKEDKQFKLAAALEMLHVATLIHDDVIDDSPLRRGLPAVHTRFGKQDAVLIGDYLLSRCFLIAAGYTSPEHAVALAQVISVICTMEIQQNIDRYRADTSIRHYFRKIMGKTAMLFSLACHVGASEAKAPKAVTERLRRAGYDIGMAFQIIDDILDYSGDQDVVRKTLGNDLKAGVVTLPLICALSLDKSGELARATSRESFPQADTEYIIGIVRSSGGIEAAREHAKRYTRRALTEISGLPRGKARDMLEKLTQHLLIRNY
ncbi:polyprenyl synthetase family protein [Breznakiella homolactica]|nr:polyprenyl synthetase family protein [Breznakiella homolactica]